MTDSQRFLYLILHLSSISIHVSEHYYLLWL